MPTIYSYSSNSIKCTYSLSLTRSGSTVKLTASGTIYGNGSSKDSDGQLYAFVQYGVSPSNTSSATTYVSSYGTSIGAGKLIVDSPLNSTTIPTSGKNFSVSWSWTNNNAVSLSNCSLFLSKSSSSPSSTTGSSYAFVGKKSSDINATYIRYYTQSLSVDAGYTACTAPTSVTANAKIVAYNTRVTISWSGATAGTNNAITKYRLYWREGSSPTTSSYTDYEDITSTSTSNSATVLLDYSRGNTYYFKVQTIGTVSGYNSGISSDYATCKINQLPSAPTVASNKTVVPSSGGSVTFTLSATDPDSQTVSFYYSTSANGTKTKINNGGSISVSSATTYYFYSYDGLEYSSSSENITIEKNTKPTVSISMSGDTLYASELLTNSNYQKFYTAITGKATTNKSENTITWFIRYAKIPHSGIISTWDSSINLGVINYSSTNIEEDFDLSSNTTLKELNGIAY